MMGGLPVQEIPGTSQVIAPRQLLNGEEHFEGMTRCAFSRTTRNNQQFENIVLPRERIHADILDQDLKRPRPRSDNA